VQVDDVISAIRPTTCLVTVMLANNETGIIQVFLYINPRLNRAYVPWIMSFILMHGPYIADKGSGEFGYLLEFCLFCDRC